MLDHVDFNQPEPPEFYVSRSGNLLYQPHLWDRKRYRVKGLGWRRKYADWAGLKGIVVRYA